MNAPRAGDDFGTAAGQQVQGGELLEEADGILRGQHRDGCAQAEVSGLPGLAASTISGADNAKSWRWWSPRPRTLMPAWSASRANSMSSTSRCWGDIACPVIPLRDSSPKVKMPKSTLLEYSTFGKRSAPHCKRPHPDGRLIRHSVSKPLSAHNYCRNKQPSSPR